jgi:hypothetical protein
MKSILKVGRKLGLFVCFGKFPCSWIRILYGPDPGQPKQCGSMRSRIHNTGNNCNMLHNSPYKYYVRNQVFVMGGNHTNMMPHQTDGRQSL